MPYTRILSLIDAELDRLQRARQLLASFFTPTEKAHENTFKKPRKRTSTAPIHSVTAEITKEQASKSVAQGSGLQDDAALIERVRKAQRRKRLPVKMVPALPSANPLCGVIPERPIFVPAKHLREAEARRQREQTPDESTLSSASADLPTAEFLRQKWLPGVSS
jgi:hypothetical protein